MNRLHLIISWGALSMLAGSGCGEAAQGVKQEMLEGELAQDAGTDDASVPSARPQTIEFHRTASEVGFAPIG